MYKPKRYVISTVVGRFCFLSYGIILYFLMCYISLDVHHETEALIVACSTTRV